jgi:hypothetical protein
MAEVKTDYLTRACKVARYVERYFQRSGRTEFPTFRTAAQACRISQREIAEFCDEGIFGLMETGLNVEGIKQGDRWVERC